MFPPSPLKVEMVMSETGGVLEVLFQSHFSNIRAGNKTIPTDAIFGVPEAGEKYIRKASKCNLIYLSNSPPENTFIMEEPVVFFGVGKDQILHSSILFIFKKWKYWRYMLFSKSIQ